MLSSPTVELSAPCAAQSVLDRAHMDADRLLCCALDVASLTLKCGGEIHRVEETIVRICRSYGAQHVEVSAITSMIHATVRLPDGTLSSQMRRIVVGANDLGQLEQCNSLSRRICSELPDYDTLQAEVRTLKDRGNAPLWQDLGGALLTVGGFAVFFGGTLFDGIAAGVIGVLMALLARYAMPFANHFARTLLLSVLGSVLSYATVAIGFGNNVDKVMIGTIMYVVPGLALGTALRDLLSDDTLSGVLRLFRSLLIAVTIALGYTAGIYLYGEGQAFSYELNTLPMLLIMSVVGPLGVALMYRVRAKHIPMILVGSELSFVVYYLLSQTIGGEFFSNLVATVVVGCFARLCARRGKFPAVVLSTPAIMPLLPGGILYYTMHNLMFGLGEETLICAERTISIALGIAAGEVAVSLLYMAIRSAHEKIKGKI
ncbi:MAG: threonine/serine exporter family protein [Clostridia bacterium]|nr:threonine/serine exporter family protein [Clostridia bacterium]